jgi:quercetin dioxygenase-like cupin family protein
MANRANFRSYALWTVEGKTMTKIREFMTSWEPGTLASMTAWTDRTKENLRGSAKGKRKPPNLRPFDLIRAPHQPVSLLANEDMRVSVVAPAGPAPFFHRNVNFDEAIFQFAGTCRVETEMGVETLVPGDMLLVPRGIAQRSVGDAHALQQIVLMKSAVTGTMGEELCTSRTEFDVKRVGGPDFSAAAAVPATTGQVTEKMYVWHENPADAVEIERVAAEMIGVSSTERENKKSALKKMRPFDLFKDITGRKGPGPKFMSSEFAMYEVYNTVGEQFAFHRALESEEFGLQFMGDNTNMSEFEETFPMSPGQWFLIPLGIAHSVKDCKPDFRRMVIYSRFPFTVLADESMHVTESRFEVRENVLEAAPWHAESRELAGAHA